MKIVKTGLDRLKTEFRQTLKGARLGLLANQASVDSSLAPAKEVVAKCLPGQLKALFGPQHGYGGEDQDNMIETGHSFDQELRVPIFSLYSSIREPLHEMFELIDVLLIDLQDVGARVYTFAATMRNCLTAAARKNKKVVVLDRPNPLGGETVEGNLLQPEFYSFVGPYRLPMRHGLTMGEMALMFNEKFELNCDLEVILMQGWRRKMLWPATGLTWIMPSPNMPMPETAWVYPGQVMLEGANLSEGRGTCRPFEIFGAPYLNARAVINVLDPAATKGCRITEYTFRPTFNKWQGELCHGFMIFPIDLNIYRPYYTTLAFLKAIIEIHPDDFKWNNPPYEYEFKKMPIDIITGTASIRRDLKAGMPIKQLEEKWLPQLEDYLQMKKKYHLYRA